MSLPPGRIRRCAVLSLMVLGIACSILGGTRSAGAQLSLTDLYYAMPAADSNSLTPTIKVSWSAPPANVTYQGMKRDTGANTAVTVVTTAPSNQMSGNYIDTNWVSGTSYRYYLYGTAHVEVLDANGNHYVPPQYIDQPWQSNLVTITPYSLPVSEDATADSRIDPRYSVTTYVNFPFNDSNTTNNPLWLYRGGLYAGYNADGGKVGRTYLKFAVAPAGAAKTLYPLGGLYVFSSRLAKTGSASFSVKRSSDSTSWVRTSLNWSNAPAPTGTAGAAKTISWSSTSPASLWYTLDIKTPVQDYLGTTGPGVLTLILMASSETTAGWGYFARKEFLYNGQSGYGARLLFGVQ